MIKHIVMWNVRGETPEQKQAAVALLKSQFEGLMGKIPGLLSVEVGADESRADYACDVVLYSEFADRDSLLAYADHPEHLRVRRAVGDARVARYQVDYASTELLSL